MLTISATVGYSSQKNWLNKRFEKLLEDKKLLTSVALQFIKPILSAKEQAKQRAITRQYEPHSWENVLPLTETVKAIFLNPIFQSEDIAELLHNESFAEWFDDFSTGATIFKEKSNSGENTVAILETLKELESPALGRFTNQVINFRSSIRYSPECLFFALYKSGMYNGLVIARTTREMSYMFPLLEYTVLTPPKKSRWENGDESTIRKVSLEYMKQRHDCDLTGLPDEYVRSITEAAVLIESTLFEYRARLNF